ncbi:MAG: superoxide dismutase family protein [Pseudolabrys sp.]|nr:superoxide dismutase family protein [Pseudolabrys sp.]
MRSPTPVLFGLVAALAVTCVTPASAQLAVAQIKDSSGKPIADANFTQTPAGVLIRLDIKGLPAGERAFHIHAVGKCEAPFTSAGPHFNPGGHKHGMMAGQAHAGDMPNLHIPQSGELSIQVLNGAVTLEKGKPNSLLKEEGTALVIHAKADDYKTDPAGDAGDRIACGVVTESGQAPK